jgi:hypothetical protein
VPVTTPHPDYAKSVEAWQRCRDVIEGSDAVKAAGETYLPRLSGQTVYSEVDERGLFTRWIDEYANYKQRALFYEATTRTVQGLVGAIFRKEPMWTVPAAIEAHFKDITLTGIPFVAMATTLVRELISVGRYGVLVDIEPGEVLSPRPRWSGYPAEAIVNWPRNLSDWQQPGAFVVLRETVSVPGDDPFMFEDVPQYRVLSLDAEGFYQVDLWRQVRERPETWAIAETFMPSIRGARLDYIPFCFSSPTTLTPMVERPPLLGIVEVNLSHYRSSADLEHGRHFCGLPTPWVKDGPTETKLKIGSGVAWMLGANGAAGMLEFTGQGLGALEKALEEKEAKMAALGARLLENPRSGVEAAETIRLRTQGEHNFLQTVAKTASQALIMLLQFHARWLRIPEERITVELNDDFVEMQLSPQDLLALLQTWQSAGISRESYLYNLQRGEILAPDVTIEEEMARIDAQAPLTLPLGTDERESPDDEGEAA